MAKSLEGLVNLCFRRQEYRVDTEPEPRMIKWTVISTSLCNIFIHKFGGPDWTLDPHDHPTDFVSIGLRGWYLETVYSRDGQKLYEKKWSAPWIRKFPATHLHRTSAVGPKGAYTVCVTSPWKQHWGFFVNGNLVSWRDYVKDYRSQRADRSQKV